MTASTKSQISDFRHRAQSIITDHFTLPRGKISFGGADRDVHAVANPPAKFSKGDFVEAGRRCAAKFQQQLAGDTTAFDPAGTQIILDEIEAMTGAARK